MSLSCVRSGETQRTPARRPKFLGKNFSRVDEQKSSNLANSRLGNRQWELMW